MLYGYAMEPYNATAVFEEGSLTVYSTAQHPYMVRDDLALMFGMPLARVRVVVPYVGGGYGTKSYTKVEPLAALGAYVTRRPVKVALSVEEAIFTTRSDGARIRARTAFRADGTLLAREFDVVMNSGAYSDNSPLVCAKLANRCFGPYRIPAVRVHCRSAFTNTTPASSLRGFGAPQGNLAGELQMDEAADRLGIDARDLRLLNVVLPGEEILPGKRGIDADLGADLRLATDSLGWGERPGVGFGIAASDAGAHPTSVTMVRLHADGSASCAVGATELGQGSRTVLSQILADGLGLEFDRVAIVAADTGVTTYERTTGASRTTTLVGRALLAACDDARAKIRQLASEFAEGEIEDVDGGIRVGGEELSYGQVIRTWFGSGGEVVGIGAIRKAGEFDKLPPFWEIGASGVAVSVDEETGRLDDRAADDRRRRRLRDQPRARARTGSRRRDDVPRRRDDGGDRLRRLDAVEPERRRVPRAARQRHAGEDRPDPRRAARRDRPVRRQGRRRGRRQPDRRRGRGRRRAPARPLPEGAAADAGTGLAPGAGDCGRPRNGGSAC